MSVRIAGLATGEDGALRQITAVGRDFIIRHYGAYGGPEHPPTS